MDPVTPPSSSITMETLSFDIEDGLTGRTTSTLVTTCPITEASNKSALRPSNLLKLLWGDLKVLTPTRHYSTTSCGLMCGKFITQLIKNASFMGRIRYPVSWLFRCLTSGGLLPMAYQWTMDLLVAGLFVFFSLFSLFSHSSVCFLIEECWWENCHPCSPHGRNQKSSPSTVPAADSAIVELL